MSKLKYGSYNIYGYPTTAKRIELIFLCDNTKEVFLLEETDEYNFKLDNAFMYAL